MGIDPRQGRVEASAPKISSSKEDRRPKADPRAKDLLKWRHVLGERASGGGAGLRLNEGWPTQRASATKPRGKDPVADLADPKTNSQEPLKREVTIKVPAKMAVAVPFHGIEGPPPPAGERALVWT